MSSTDGHEDPPAAPHSLDSTPSLDRARADAHGPAVRSAPMALLAAVAFLLYLPALRGDLIWDDLWLLGPRDALEGTSWTGALFDTSWLSFAPDRYYRPLVFWSHRLDLALWGRSWAGHHLTNAVVYGVSVWALGFLLARAGAGRWAIVTALLLFAAHPCHVEAVAWISGRHDLLAAALGLLATAILAGSGDSAVTTGAAATLLFLSLLSKEVALAFPLAWLLAMRRSDRAGSDSPPLLDGRSALAAAALALAAYAVLRANAAGLTRGYPYGWPTGPAEALASTLVNLKVAGRMLATLLAGADYGPLAANQMTAQWRLSHAPGSPDVPWLDCETILAFVALVSLLPLVLRTALAGGPRALGMGLIVCPIAAAMNLTTADRAASCADRYLFLPSAGLAILVASAIDGLDARGRRREALRWCIIVSGLAVLGSVKSLDGMVRYRDRLTFWGTAVRLDPLSPKAHSDLGIWLMVDGQLDRAHAELATSWAIAPLTAALQGLIEVEVEQGRDEAALARALDPPVPIVSRATFAALALAAARTGRLALSQRYLQRVDVARGGDARMLSLAAKALEAQMAHLGR